MKEVSDHRLLQALQSKIWSSGETRLFKSTAYCGSRVIRGAGIRAGVTVAVNDVTARFFGQTSCKNPWFCPVCSARVMSRYASDIAAAIDALAAPPYNQSAVMITLTVPHTRGMSCNETTQILLKTWKDFVTHGNKVGEKNKTSGRWASRDPFLSFCTYFNCTHRVRVGEFTYGEHGWHPHFHCLFWVDTKKVKEVLEWEDLLDNRWIELAKRNTLRAWNNRVAGTAERLRWKGVRSRKHIDAQIIDDDKGITLAAASTLDKDFNGTGGNITAAKAVGSAIDKKALEKNIKRLEIMYARRNAGSQGLYISKDASGVIIQKSSAYICGWGADREVTGNYKQKASNEGHETPYEILKRAVAGDEKAWDLYFEFAKAVKERPHIKRIAFSVHSGIRKIIAKWRRTREYAEVLKKNAIRAQGPWKPVVWLSEEQWSLILYHERWLGMPLRAEILVAARAPNAPAEVRAVLLDYGLDIGEVHDIASTDTLFSTIIA